MKFSAKLNALATVGTATLAAMPVAAANNYNSTYIDGTQKTSGANDTDLMTTAGTVINVALGLIGLIAVIIIIYGGIQYMTSTGDSTKVKKAKDTILYGIIGLVVALLAYAIVKFVLGAIFN